MPYHIFRGQNRVCKDKKRLENMAHVQNVVSWWCLLHIGHLFWGIVCCSKILDVEVASQTFLLI
jgi:hypothetical protein